MIIMRTEVIEKLLECAKQAGAGTIILYSEDEAAVKVQGNRLKLLYNNRLKQWEMI